jgi:two-component system, NtrC family, response regulator GlrR
MTEREAGEIAAAAAEDAPPAVTLPFQIAAAVPGAVRRFRLTVVSGPGEGKRRESRADRCSIGHHPLNDLVVEDATVSRFHCEVVVDDDGRARARDLGSRNGTLVDGVPIVECFLHDGSTLSVGQVVVRFDVGDRTNPLRLCERTEFGDLVGRSAAMRACFALLERAAATEVTLLLDGETGTGKSAAAEAVHRASARHAGPFVVVDCGAIPAPLLESELFGHEKGSFTGASERRRGAFEEAGGGTLLLDEIGELPLELQPKLLRVLEQRQIRRVGSNAYFPVDVRMIAATHRDLRLLVNEGRFRSDLFFRLAVVKILIPPLRRRPEDIPALIERLLAAGGHDGAGVAALRAPGALAELQRAAWPGNVRELRNYVERCLFYGDAPPPADEPPPSRDVDVDRPLAEARRRVVEQFERAYLQKLLARHQGRMKDTADAAGINRVHLYKLLRKLGVQ